MAQPSLGQEEINTFIFLDTETTGLPSPGNKTRITEISLLAYSQNELLSKTKHPRVCNKLTLCFDPCRPIQLLSSEISGLHNDALEGLPTFRKQSPLIISFLKSLPPSVCLVAHNGNNFDFPLLKAELKRSEHHEDIDTILCADSLWVFRNLDGLPAVPPAHSDYADKQKLPPRVEESERDHSFNVNRNNLNSIDSADKVNTNLHEKLPNPRKQDISVTSDSKDHFNSCPSSNATDTVYSSLVPDVREHEMTPEKSQVRKELPNPLKRGSSDIHQPESSARKRLFVAGSESSSNSQRQIDKETIFDQNNIRRSNRSDPVKNIAASQNYVNQRKAPKSYSLPKLYKDYFGQEPDVSHTAEDDCITLVKIVRLKAKEFLAWCNQNSVPFKNIHPMY